MLHINELAINELAQMVGVEPEKLKSELVVDADAAPTETKIKDVLANAVIMPKTNYEQLLDNTRKTKFDEGKNRALNDFTKVALGDKAFEVTPEMKREDVWDKIKSAAQKDWEKEHGKAPSEWMTEKEKLQRLIQDKESEVEKLKSEVENTRVSSTKREKILAAVSAIPFESTGEILSKQREVVLKNVLSSYELKIEDGKDVYYKDGQKLVDNYLNPLKIEDIVKDEAVIFPMTKASNGRGDQSSKNNNHQSGDLDADLKKAPTMGDLHKILEARGLSPLGEEGRAVITRWAELHKKSA